LGRSIDQHHHAQRHETVPTYFMRPIDRHLDTVA
jgi:hypothetical protein